MQGLSSTWWVFSGEEVEVCVGRAVGEKAKWDQGWSDGVGANRLDMDRVG